jgi:hypothetical protein
MRMRVRRNRGEILLLSACATWCGLLELWLARLLCAMVLQLLEWT